MSEADSTTPPNEFSAPRKREMSVPEDLIRYITGQVHGRSMLADLRVAPIGRSVRLDAFGHHFRIFQRMTTTSFRATSFRADVIRADVIRPTSLIVSAEFVVHRKRAPPIWVSPGSITNGDRGFQARLASIESAAF